MTELIPRVKRLEDRLADVPPPPNFVHSLASLEERLTRRITAVEVTIEGFVTAHSQMAWRHPDGGEIPVASSRPSGHTTLAALTERRDADARGVPDGVVPPHVKRNLEAIEQWTRPDLWTLTGLPEEQVRTRAMLDKFHGLVMLALAGEDVPRPSA